MLDGMMLVWFPLTAVSVMFVAVDSRSTPASPVLKWGFRLFTVYTGPIGAFLYVLGCREPLPKSHERYVTARWRQTLGSTIHCVAGDGIGILAGAVLGSLILMSTPLEVVLEYVLGFGFGWTIFQALFMKDMAGGSYGKALRTAFLPEFLSMNWLMAAMVPVATLFRTRFPEAHHPSNPAFWFAMSMALLAGFVAAYPINWWLVSRHLKHGMLTVRPSKTDPSAAHGKASPSMSVERRPGPSEGAPRDAVAGTPVSNGSLVAMTTLSLVVLALGLAVARYIAGRA
ncbi:MAG: DUF4396 domain-containing protein [Pseudomonadota bacterium]|nr:DUF4396 domain-containing protein [Pseudomonadota bacterium]